MQGDVREKVARIVDHEGYWERLDSCNHALTTVQMSDESRRALTAVRDDEQRATAESLAKADSIITLLRDALLSDEVVGAGARGLDPAIWKDDLPVPTRSDTIQFHARRQASVTEARAALSAALAKIGAQNGGEHG